MRVEILNKSMNVATHDTIATFLLHDFPKCLLAEFNTHRVLSRNWESARARPIASVIHQIMTDPYIPSFTGKAKGMRGAVIDEEMGDRAKYRWLNARDNAVLQAQEMIAIGIHKQDANRLLEPWMKVSGIVTATERGNFYRLRDHEDAQPAFREFAAEMYRLDIGTESRLLGIGEWHKPWLDLDIAANTCKAASISYVNHAKDRTHEDYLRIHDDLKNATPRHASPFEHCAMTVGPEYCIGSDLENDWRVFDPINLAASLEHCYDLGRDRYISTANFSGFLQYRKIVEAGLKVDTSTGLVS